MPRNAAQIAAAWNYDQPAVLYKGDVFGELMKRKLMGVAKREKKSNLYLALFNGYFDLLEKEVAPTEVSKALLDDKAIWLEVLDAEEVRRFFLSLEAMKLLFSDNFQEAKKSGFTKSIYTAAETICLFSLLENEFGVKVEDFVRLMNPLSKLLPLGFGDYYDFILKKTPFSFWSSARAKKVLKTAIARQVRGRVKPIANVVKLLKTVSK